ETAVLPGHFGLRLFYGASVYFLVPHVMIQYTQDLYPGGAGDCIHNPSLLLFCKNTVFQADRHLSSLKEAGGRPEFTFYLFQQLIKWNIVVQINCQAVFTALDHDMVFQNTLPSPSFVYLVS